MAIVGLIPFVYATIRRKRRRSTPTARDADCYARLRGDAARGIAHARGAYQSQSCHFAVVRPPIEDDEVGFSYDNYGGAALCPPPKTEKDLSREPVRPEGATGAVPLPGRESARFDGGGGGCHSQSCRLAVRTSLVDELVASCEDGASRRPPTQPEGLSRRLLLPAGRHDGLATGAVRGLGHARPNGRAYHSQSCRFVVHRSAAYEHVLSHDKGYGVASTSPEDLSGKLLLTADRRDHGASRSMRFISMRVFARGNDA